MFVTEPHWHFYLYEASNIASNSRAAETESNGVRDYHMFSMRPS
jgi:hypothetical protein